LFSKVVALAEKQGKPVSLLVVPGTDVFDAIMMTAQRLDSSRVVSGLSTKLSADEQAKMTGDAWERLPEPKPRLTMEIIVSDGRRYEYPLGPHEPRLRPSDVELLHRIWLEVTSNPQFAGLHHFHVLALALRDLERDLHSPKRESLLEEILRDRDS
jgi:hypothetical protein